MSEPPADGDAGRLTACRACGHRVARSARRCPACGTAEPTGMAARVPPPPRSRRRRRRWGSLAALVGAALAGAAVTAAILTLRPAPPPPTLERPPVPRPASTPSPAPPAAPEPSRSRGRTDWLFFFKTGDELVRMGDEAPIGMVIRTVPSHVFGDGTVGPAYLVQVPDGGGQRFVDADELERGGRLR